MSHEKVFGGVHEVHEFICDGEMCNATDSDEGDFSEVWDKLKRDGWVCRKDDAGNWCHYCPNCREDK